VRLRHAALFAAVFANFLVWAVVKPIFQAPDEFAHLTKTLSVPTQPWITTSFRVEVQERLYNPLLDVEALHQVPFHPARKFDAATLDALQRAEWTKRGDASTAAHRSTSFYFPILYFAALFPLGEGATRLLDLSPYDAVFAYRIASAALSAALWTLVWASLGFLGRYRAAVFALLVLQPMVGFFSSAINPDAFSLPLSALVMVTSWDALFRGRGLARALAALLALVYTKSAGIVVFPTLAALVALAWLARRLRAAELEIHWRAAALLVPGAFALYWITFYAWSPVVVLHYGFHESLLSYVARLPSRVPGFFTGYWSGLGWLDYSAPRPVLLGILGLLAANAAVFAARFRRLEEPARFAYLLGFAALYAGALVAAEFAKVPRWGYAIQGRYFLPVALGVAVLVCHPVAWLRRAFVAFLVVFQLLCLQLTVDRYYGGDWSLAWRALPFRGAGAEAGRSGAAFPRSSGAGAPRVQQLDRMVEHRVAVEQEAAREAAPLEDEGQPEGVVLPHLAVGDRVEAHPERRRLVRLRGLADAVRRREHEHVDGVAVHELEAVLAEFPEPHGPDAQLLFHLAQRAGLRRLAGLEPPSRAVDLPRAEAALLADQEDPPVAHHEDERRQVASPPARPVEVVEGLPAHGRLRALRAADDPARPAAWEEREDASARSGSATDLCRRSDTGSRRTEGRRPPPAGTATI
jgi:hypothetical protein